MLRASVMVALHVLAGALVVVIVGVTVYVEHQPEVRVWHTAELDAEFTAASKLKNFSEYLALEDRLFAQLEERVYAQSQASDQSPINRFTRGSHADATSWTPNWNRSFELATDQPERGVLLLHGLSDAPYSLRSAGQRLHEAGAYVVGLRIPGHGTAPSGLARVQWEDMAAAVRLAMLHLRDKLGDRPIYVIGYSNGGALAVHDALDALEDRSLPRAERLVLISPEIGISRLAALAVWQQRLGRLLGIEKLAWNSIELEYDPYKYGSFAVNAGEQAHRLTTHNRARLQAMGQAGQLADFPRVLAFQSAVDATVSPAALVRELFLALPERGHELVAFDINHRIGILDLLRSDPAKGIRKIVELPERRFTFTLLTNEKSKTSEQAGTVLRSWPPGEVNARETALGLAWPDNVYSLAHIALPFGDDDPIYGEAAPSERAGIHLGDLALRGERGVLKISAASMLRMHWNPFYSYLEERVLAFFGETHR